MTAIKTLLVDEVEAINFEQVEHPSDADDDWLHVPHLVRALLPNLLRQSFLGKAGVLDRSSNNPNLFG